MAHYRVLFITIFSIFSLQHMHITAMEFREKISEAIDGGKVEQVRSLLFRYRNYKEIYSKDRHQKNTLLHEACQLLKERRHNDKDSMIPIIEELLTISGEHDANEQYQDNELLKYHVDAQNRNGNTPFHYINEGTVCPEQCIVKWFFEKGANPNIPNKEGNTPFHYFIKGKTSRNDYDENIIKLFLENDADPNLQNKDGDTPFHYMCQINANKLIKLFLKHGAHEYILNKIKKTPYRLGLEVVGIKKNFFMAAHNNSRYWHHIKNRVNWQEYQEKRPDFIRKKFRYYALDEACDNEFINSDQHVISMVTIHDGDDQENEDYYNPKNKQFKRIMEFAQEYITTYNMKKNDNAKKKFLHLLSFSWQNNVLVSAKQLARYLDKEYRNARLIFLAGGFGCDLANLVSHELGMLDKINTDIEKHNEENPNNKKLYKGRIKLLLYFDPLYRHVIPEDAKSSLINPAGMLYDALNNTISTRPTNYNLLLTFYSPHDKKIKPNTFSNEMNAVTDALMGLGGLMLYAGGENFVEKGITTPTLLLGGTGSMTISYALWSRYSKEKTINNLSNIALKNPGRDNSLIIEGPKIHLKTKVNNKYIGHRDPKLSKNLFTIYDKLNTQYNFTKPEDSRSFCIDIDIDDDNDNNVRIDADQTPFDVLDNRYL